MIVMGFDPSLTNFGWVVYDSTALGADKCVARGRFQTSSKQLFIDRYIELRTSLLALLQEHKVERVGCEYPVFGNLYSEGMYALFMYTCEALRVHKTDVVFFSPGQLKAHARDFLERPKLNGKLWEMKKPDMVEAARKDAGGFGTWNHNEADAYWAARSGARFWSYLDGSLSVDDLTVNEKKQFTEVHNVTRGRDKGAVIRKGIEYREDERFFLWRSGNGA